jgi:uncharacterized protein
MDITWLTTALLCIAMLVAGVVNALAGGGTLLTFPALMAAGLSALSANATNSAAICLGFAGAAYGQRHDLKTTKSELGIFLVISFVGGLIGGILLIALGGIFFQTIVPFLLLGACLLLAFQDPIRKMIFPEVSATRTAAHKRNWSFIAVGIASVYGGYFGAGMSVILLAILGLTHDGTLREINALKQPISLTANLAACLYFLIRGQIVLPLALILGIAAIGGGLLGGLLAEKIRPSVLRWTVILLGFAITAGYFWKLFAG